MAIRKKSIPSIDLAALLPSWYRALRAENAPPLTQRTYKARMLRFQRFLAGHKLSTTVGDISPDVCKEFLADILDHGKPATALGHWGVLRSFFNWCTMEKEIDESPMARIKQPKVPREHVVFLTDDEIVRLLKTCSGKTFLDRRDLAIIRLFLSAGPRRGELHRLQIEDINLDQDVALIRHGKGGDPRFVAFDRITSSAIDSYLRIRTQQTHADLPDLWLTSRGAMNYETINTMLHKRGNQAGLPTIHPHLFRHGFAHAYMAAKGDIINLTSLGGWKDMGMVKNVYGTYRQNQVAIDEHHDLHIGEKWK
jgi:site-specific recombinase XerD